MFYFFRRFFSTSAINFMLQSSFFSLHLFHRMIFRHCFFSVSFDMPKINRYWLWYRWRWIRSIDVHCLLDFDLVTSPVVIVQRILSLTRLRSCSISFFDSQNQSHLVTGPCDSQCVYLQSIFACVFYMFWHWLFVNCNRELTLCRLTIKLPNKNYVCNAKRAQRVTFGSFLYAFDSIYL